MEALRKYHLPDWREFAKMSDGIWQREFYTNQGPLAMELETKLKEFLGVKHVICMTNSSIALMIAVLASGVKNTVLVPAFSHINVSQSVIWAGGKIQFVDSEINHPAMDVDHLQTKLNSSIELIIALNPSGDVCRLEEMERQARQNGIRLMFISDTVFGNSYNGRKIGGFGDMEIFSFRQGNMVNGGDGAIVCTSNDDLAARLRNIRSSYGAGNIVPIPFTGNGRMSEIQAGTILLSLNEWTNNKDYYNAKFQVIRQKIEIFGELVSRNEKLTGESYFSFLFRLKEGIDVAEIAEFENLIHSQGMGINKWDLFGIDPNTGKKIGPESNAFKLMNRLLCISFS